MLMYRIAGCMVRMMLIITVCAVPALSAEQLSLDGAVKTALTKNPRVLAAQGDVRAAQAKAKGAGALPNPEISITPSIAGPAGSDEELFISQPLEINGARSARKKIASAETKAVDASRQITMREVARDTKAAYWNAVLANALVDLNKENVQMNETLYTAAKRQQEIGSAPGAQVLKAEVELARARQELTQAESERNRTLAALRTVMGVAPDAEVELTDKLSYVPVEYDDAKVASSANANRPELQESAAKIEARKGEVDAARAARRPDVAFQARQETFGGEGGLALGFNVPIFDWGSNKAQRQSAQESVKAEEHRLAAARNTVALEVQDAVTRLIEADTLVKRYDEGTLTQSQKLTDMAQKGYKAGATSYLEVLEAQRTLRSVRTEYYTALADHAKAKAELEWAAAIDLSKPAEVKK